MSCFTRLNSYARIISVLAGLTSGLMLVSCNTSQGKELPSHSQELPKSNAARIAPRNYKIGALIYHGEATAYGDPEAIASILDDHQVTYQTVSSEELDAMSLDDLSQFGMIIWPGGYAGYMSESIHASTRERIRLAVNERGVSYVGFCAGAFIAISPAAEKGQAGPDWGFALIDAPTLPYYHLQDEGIDYSMVSLKMANGSTRSVVWWGGPYLNETKGDVVARYSDTGQPAITQNWAGKGLMILAGPHPEAPESWRDKLGLNDPDGLDQDIAWQMFDAALNQKPLQTF